MSLEALHRVVTSRESHREGELRPYASVKGNLEVPLYIIFSVSFEFHTIGPASVGVLGELA